MKKQVIQYLSAALFLALLFWGGRTVLLYIGVPVHAAVLLGDAARTMVQQLCGASSSPYFCIGWNGFVPALTNTLARAEPFLWYGLLSLLAYIVVVGWQSMMSGRFELNVRMQPWKIYVGFIVSLWVLFTVLSTMPTGDQASIRQVVEPLPQVYSNAGPEVLAALQNNFQRLFDGGCLTLSGTLQNGARLFMLKTSCVQASFFTRVLSQFLLVSLLLFELLLLGSFLLKIARFPMPKKLFLEGVLSVALGAAAWVVLLWAMAVLGILTQQAGWVLFIVVPLVCYRQVIRWLTVFVRETWIVRLPWYSPVILLSWLLITYLTLNFLNVVRPFPIGWDDLGSYLNRPRLLVSYGEFISSMQSFQWEYLTSLGFLLFGFDSPTGATFAMLINWSAGLLAVLAVFLFGRTFLGRGQGILAALLYYALPLTGHFSFADMKIDNAVFFMSTVAVLCVFYGLFSPEEDDESSKQAPAHWRTAFPWVLLGGVFMGFAFSFKVTSVMAFMGLGMVILGSLLHGVAVLGALCLMVMVYASRGALDISQVADRITGGADPINAPAFIWVLTGLGVLGIGAAAALGRRRIVSAGVLAGLLGVGFVIPVMTWMYHNNVIDGVYIPKYQLGATAVHTPLMDFQGTMTAADGGRRPVRSLPPELVIDPTHSACGATGAKEELDRYWGFGSGWMHYITLPWRSVMNLDSAGYYVTTMPALLLFPLLLLVPYFWTRRGKWLRWMFVYTFILIGQWVFLANGIPWYGIGMFLGLAIGLEALIAKAPDVPSRILSGLLIGMSIMLMFNMRLWQFDQQKNLFEYPFGKIDAVALQERTIPHYDDVRDSVLERAEQFPDRPYLYRVGTFIAYFIPKNLQYIGITDHQLDTFNCLYQERDPKKTVARLKALGFNSIVFDTNTHTIEKDPNGSLHRKVNSFVDFLNNPESGLQVVFNDPGAGIAYVLIP